MTIEERASDLAEQLKHQVWLTNKWDEKKPELVAMFIKALQAERDDMREKAAVMAHNIGGDPELHCDECSATADRIAKAIRDLE